MAAEVHPTATVHPGTILGEGVKVLENAVVGKQPSLSPRSTAKREPLPPTEIGEGTIVSTGAIVFAGSRIGARVILGDQSCVRERVTIGDDVVLGRGSLVENDTAIGARSRIQADAYITAYSTLEEDVFVWATRARSVALNGARTTLLAVDSSAKSLLRRRDLLTRARRLWRDLAMRRIP